MLGKGKTLGALLVLFVEDMFLITLQIQRGSESDENPPVVIRKIILTEICPHYYSVGFCLIFSPDDSGDKTSV